MRQHYAIGHRDLRLNKPRDEVSFSSTVDSTLLIRRAKSRSAPDCCAAAPSSLLSLSSRGMYCLAVRWKGNRMSLQPEGETIQIIDAHIHIGGDPDESGLKILATCFMPNTNLAAK